MSVTAKVKMAFLWLAFAITCILPASALTPIATENRIWEISSIGYDAVAAEVTDLGNRTETSTSDYDIAPIHRAATEKIQTQANRSLFGQNAEFKAAEEWRCWMNLARAIDEDGKSMVETDLLLWL